MSNSGAGPAMGEEGGIELPGGVPVGAAGEDAGPLVGSVLTGAAVLGLDGCGSVPAGVAPGELEAHTVGVE